MCGNNHWIICQPVQVINKYFELKTHGAPMRHPKLELLASNGVATFVMPFSITLNARHTHQTDAHMHTQTHTNTPTHIIQTQSYTPTHTHTHTHVLCVCLCMCMHMPIHTIIHDHSMQWVTQLRALMHSDS